MALQYTNDSAPSLFTKPWAAKCYAVHALLRRSGCMGDVWELTRDPWRLFPKQTLYSFYRLQRDRESNSRPAPPLGCIYWLLCLILNT